ncbi:hypothetical protein ACS0TY_024065 [Phlomoides rotata]
MSGGGTSEMMGKGKLEALEDEHVNKGGSTATSPTGRACALTLETDKELPALGGDEEQPPAQWPTAMLPRRVSPGPRPRPRFEWEDEPVARLSCLQRVREALFSENLGCCYSILFLIGYVLLYYFWLGKWSRSGN